jgi:hypothetical protein
MNTQYNDPKGAAGALKTPLGLIPPYAMDQTAWAHKLGAEKYGPFNWRDTGVCASTYINAIMRHLNAWRDGENLDPESGISHLAHIACSCNILMDADYCDTLQDDRNVVPNADIKFMTANEYFSGTFPDEQEPEREEAECWRNMYSEYTPLLNILKEFYTDNNGYVALAEDATIEEGDEYYDIYEREWVKSSYVGMPITVSRLLYRRPIKQENPHCKCGSILINHYTLGVICEDCDLQWQDPY